MKKIEINTSQNVTIEYNLASVADRILAFFLDSFFVGSGSGIILGMYASVSSTFSQIVMIFIFLIPALFYHLTSEILMNGQSFGKKIARIKVIKLNGEKPLTFDFVMRWIFRIADIMMSIGILAVVMITSSSKSQRLGDFLSDMIVIKLNSTGNEGIQLLLKKFENSNYIPKYPEIKSFREKDMLIIKKTIDRYQKFPKKGSIEAVEVLVKKIEEQLEIKAPQQKIEFLNQLIKDYIFLTR